MSENKDFFTTHFFEHSNKYFFIKKKKSFNNKKKTPGKMDVLTTNKKVLTWLSLYKVEENTSNWERIGYILVALMVFLSNFCNLVSSVSFFVGNFSSNLEDALYSCTQINAYLAATYMMIIAFIDRFEISSMLDELLIIYEKSKFAFESSFI